MSTTLIRNGIVITMNPEDHVYLRGWVLLRDDTIEALGEGEPPAEAKADKEINAAGMAVLPGIVNTHTHVCGSLFKAATEDVDGGFYGLALPMEDLLTPEFTYVLSMLGAVECLKGGVTFINDLYHYMRDTARAVDELGMRGVVAQKIIECNLATLQYNDYTRTPGEAQKRIEENVRLIEEYHGRDGRIFCKFGPHATDTISVETARQIVDLGHRYGVGFHTHVAQKIQEVAFMKEKYGLTPVEYLVETGLMGKDLVAAHCIYITDNDVELLAKGGCTHAYCAEMLGKRGGVPPLVKMRAKGVRTAFGTDWVTMDPWTDMRIAIIMSRLQGSELHDMDAHVALRKFTSDAAEYMGFGDTLGSLEAGKQADVVLMNMSSANLVPVFEDPIATLVYNANRHDVDTVIVKGKTLVSGGEVKTVDEAEVLREGQRVSTLIYNAWKSGKTSW